MLFYLLSLIISSKTSKHSGSWKQPADQFRWPQCGMIKSFACSFWVRNWALHNGTRGSLSPWITVNLCVDWLISSKSKSFSKKLSNFLLLFASEGDETRIIPEIFTSLACSRNLRIAGPPRECPIRYISSCVFSLTCRSISPTHSEQSGFSGVGIERAHAYMSLFSNSHISHGRHPPFGLPSKPWIIKTFFIHYLPVLSLCTPSSFNWQSVSAQGGTRTGTSFTPSKRGYSKMKWVATGSIIF